MIGLLLANFMRFNTAMKISKYTGLLLLLSATSASVFAADASSSHDLQALVAAQVSKSETVSSNIVDLQNDEYVFNQMLKVEKVQLERAKVKAELEEVKEGKKKEEKKEDDSFNQQMGIYPNQVMQGKLPEPEAVPPKPPIERVFFTRIYGMEGSMSAFSMYEGAISIVKIGDEVAPGVKVAAIRSGSVVLTDGTTKRTVSLTTEARAYALSLPDEPKKDVNMGLPVM